MSQFSIESFSFLFDFCFFVLHPQLPLNMTEALVPHSAENSFATTSYLSVDSIFNHMMGIIIT